MKAVIYARYSSDNQREESIEGQVRECTAFAAQNGMTVIKHYIDRAFSAKTDNRPEFQQMIKDSGKRVFDTVIVWKLDRFARNRYDSAHYKSVLKKNNIRVVSATELISTGAEGILLESILEGYAEYYSADLSEKVSRGMTENVLKHKSNGGNRTYGYTINAEGRFVVDPVESPIVQEIFTRYAEGYSLRQIKIWLDNKGIKGIRGNSIDLNTLGRMLKNRRYLGELRFKGITEKDGIPQIIPHELFDKVQAVKEKNRKAPARHKAIDDYLLTTKICCGHCGAYMCGESGTSRTKTVYHYYKCVSVKKKRRECENKPIRKNILESLVVNLTIRTIMDDAAIEAVIDRVLSLQEQDNAVLACLEEQLRNVNRNINNLVDAIQQGVFTKSTKQRLDELEATREELEVKIDTEKLAAPKLSREFIRFWLTKFKSLDVMRMSHKKMLINAFINKVFLYNDKIIVTYNLREGTDSITLSDVEEAINGSDLESLAAPNDDNPNLFIVKNGFGLFYFL